MIKQVWAAAIYTQDMWHLLGVSVSRKSHCRTRCSFIACFNCLVQAFSALCARSGRARGAEIQPSLLFSLITVEALSQELLPALPSLQGSTGSPEQTWGRGCPKPGQEGAGEHPRGWDRAGGQGRAGITSHPSNPWDGQSGTPGPCSSPAMGWGFPWAQRSSSNTSGMLSAPGPPCCCVLGHFPFGNNSLQLLRILCTT